MLDHIEVLDAATAFANDPLRSVQPDAARDALIRALSSAMTVVVENGYIDRDYSSAYYLQLSRAFTPQERCTKRIHFFEKSFDKDALASCDLECLTSIADSYLGFTIVRPGTPRTLGRTYIRPPTTIDGEPAYFPTACEIETNLCGIALRTRACPYLSQDGMVLACATASVWMSVTPLGIKLQEIATYDTSEITALAEGVARPFTPITGARGLTLDGIRRALLAMGFDPQVFQNPSAQQLFEACHIYVESGLAPILVVTNPQLATTPPDFSHAPLHAVTIVGHTFDTSAWSDTPIAPGVHSTAEFVTKFVVNDDQRGMYVPGRIEGLNDAQGDTRACLTMTVNGVEYVSACIAVFFPLPSRVMREGTHVMYSMAGSLRYLRDDTKALQDKGIVVRTFLTKSNSFKTAALRTRADLPDELRGVYRTLSLPRYIWVVEFAYVDDWRGKPLSDLRVRGEIILDSTTPSRGLQTPLAVHVPGVVAYNDVAAGTSKTGTIPLHETAPYTHYDSATRP